jgi:hypothetical protein
MKHQDIFLYMLIMLMEGFIPNGRNRNKALGKCLITSQSRWLKKMFKRQYFILRTHLDKFMIRFPQ